MVYLQAFHSVSSFSASAATPLGDVNLSRGFTGISQGLLELAFRRASAEQVKVRSTKKSRESASVDLAPGNGEEQ